MPVTTDLVLTGTQVHGNWQDRYQRGFAEVKSGEAGLGYEADMP
jgi:hypothetical protein